MILQCNYEEIRALRAGARALLDAPSGGCGAVAAPPRGRAEVEALLPQLDGDMGFNTLAELQRVLVAVDAIVVCLRAEMEVLVTTAHPAHEHAVAAYFDFAHALCVYDRLRHVGERMEAMIEVVTGEPSNEVTARGFVFPD